MRGKDEDEDEDWDRLGLSCIIGLTTVTLLLIAFIWLGYEHVNVQLKQVNY